jgi:hypothetical protein
MYTNRFCRVFIWACFCSSLLIPQNGVQAQGLRFVEIPLESFHEERPIEIHGLVSSQTLNIPIPQNWLIGADSWIEIDFTPSPLLDAGRSSITILLNDLQIISYDLARLPEARERIPIPANRFTQGINTLTISGTLYLPGDAETNCQNWDDPARWVAIEPGGLLHLSFAERDLQIDLSSFPQTLIQPLDRYLPDSIKTRTLIVLPDRTTHDDLTSLSTLSYVLGSSADPGHSWQPEIVKASQWKSSTAANRNIIFIGAAPAEFQDGASRDKDYIGLFPSPWSAGNTLLILGDRDRQDGFSPAGVFGDRANRVLLRGNIAYIDRFLPPAPQAFQSKYSFEDLGYLDRTVRGLGQQNLIYSLYIPYDVEPTLVRLNLGLAHSPDLDTRNSAFTVFLNGFSIAGIRPTDRSSTGEPITMGLPAKKFRRGVNFIRIRFDMHVPYSSCERGLESVWATVLNNSTLEITSRNRTPIPSLKHFPLPFSDDSGFTFVIPDEHQPQDLAHISQLSFLLGSMAFRPSRPPEVLTAADFDRRDIKPLHVILVGLPSENSVTRNTNDLLPQPFQEAGDSLQDGYGVYLPTADQHASLGLMEIIPSPWVKGGTVLVLTGNDQQGLEWAWQVILNPALRDQFAGNLMVVGSGNRSAASGLVSAPQSPLALFQQVADAANIPIIGPILQKSGQAFLIPAFVAIGSALFLVLGILWIMNAARRRKTSSMPEEAGRGEEDEQ